jgi:4-hydroxy-tetrahydrodipicolinate synthase
MKEPIFTGANVAIVTPFTENGINLPKLGELIEFQIQNGINAITICGTTGESSTLTHEEHCQAIEYCVKKVAGRVPVIAGTGSNDTEYALCLSKYAEEVGVNGLLMTTPYYNKTSQYGLVKSFTYLADRLNTPIILYNVPSRTGIGFKAETYLELSKHPMINGIKEASGDFSLIANTLSLCGDELNIWSGNDDNTVAMMALGAKGVISVAANIIPGAVAKMCRLFFEGKVRESAAMQIELFELMNALFIEVNPIPVKTAVALMGMDNGLMRLPLCEMQPKNVEILKKAMVNAGIKLA